MNFSKNEKMAIWKIISVILHIGNVQYEEKHSDHEDGCSVINFEEMLNTAKFLQVDYANLNEAFTTKYRVIASQKIKSKLSKSDCYFLRFLLNFY